MVSPRYKMPAVSLDYTTMVLGSSQRLIQFSHFHNLDELDHSRDLWHFRKR